MADRVVVMNGGVIEQAGPPQELYHRPVSQFVAGFIGSPSMNFLPARLSSGSERLAVVLEDGTELPVPEARVNEYRRHAGKSVVFGIRPESIRDRQQRPGFADVVAKIDLVEPLGPETMVYFSIGEANLCACIDPESNPKPLTAMPLSFNMNQMHLFDVATGVALSLPKP